MTHRERLLNILEGKQPDYLPWYGDLDYWANSLIKRGLKPKDFIGSDEYIQWHADLNVGFYLQGYFMKGAEDLPILKHIYENTCFELYMRAYQEE
jgi:hypothetical protein